MGDYSCNLPSSFVEIAEKELKETEDSRRNAFDELLRLVTSETELNVPLSDIRFFLPFLRVTKFDSKKAFDRLRSYYRGCSRYSDDFDQVFPSKMVPVLRQNVQVVIPRRNSDGTTVIYVKFSNWDPEQFSALYMFQSDWLIAEKLVEEEETQIAGVTLVYNVESFGMQHLKQITPSHMYKASNVGFRGIPLRCKGIHIIHENPMLRTAFRIVSPFLPRKIRNRFHFHGEDLASLHKFVDPSILPADLGGTNTEDFTNDQLIEDLLSWEPSFRERRKYGYKSV